MKNTLLIALSFATLAGCATSEAPLVVTQADPVDCIDRPAHEKHINKHGQSNWSDTRLYVHKHQNVPVRIPMGWQPVGQASIQGSCAVFPDKQAVIFIRPSAWDIKRIPSPETGLTLVRYALKDMPKDELSKIDGMITRVHKRVRQIYPLGLKPDQQWDHNLLVTTGIAGDAKSRNTRLFAEPGERLTLFFRNADDGRAYDLLTHTTTHLFNKRRPRVETQPEDPMLPRVEHLEFVASWAELALAEDKAYLKQRLDYIYDIHAVVTDGDPKTWPKRGTLRFLNVHKGKIGVPPRTREISGPMMEYLHYYLNPLALVALDGLLADRGRKLSVMGMLQEVHSSDASLLDVFKLHLTPNELAQFELWLGGERIPRVLVNKGIERYQGMNYLDWSLKKGWAKK